MDPIPLHRPYLTGREAELLAEATRSRKWSGDGPMTARASRLLEAATGSHRAFLTTSCTDALELAALLFEVAPGDEVIVPAFTFVSTANAFALRGARPVFVDIRPDTLNLDERLLAAAITPRTRAIVVVHYGGVACEMDAIAEVKLPIVEDTAHGLFGSYRGRPLGSIGTVGALSFHETKNITCGEGGALLVNDPALVARAEILREKGTNRGRFFRGEVDTYTWVDLGSSFLPSDLLAAFLVAQLEAAREIQAARHRAWATYAAELAPWAAHHGIALPAVPPHCTHPAHNFYLLLPDLARRTALLAHLAARNVRAAFHYQPLHLSDFARRWGGKPGDLPVTERVADTLVRLPLYPDLDEPRQRRVIDAVTSFAP
jgi:dTDP-4-amino-4,6-dideoxygalactose transaminase